MSKAERTQAFIHVMELVAKVEAITTDVESERPSSAHAHSDFSSAAHGISVSC